MLRTNSIFVLRRARASVDNEESHTELLLYVAYTMVAKHIELNSVYIALTGYNIERESTCNMRVE